MSQPEFVHTKTITFPGMVARIYSPVLTEEEKNRRMQRIYKATAEILKGVKK